MNMIFPVFVGFVLALLLNLSFTVRSGTTRMRHRTMAEFASAQSGIHATPQMSSQWIAGPSHQSWRSQKRMEPRERVLPRGSPFFWLLG
jgi:hypothetical protein